MALVVRGSGPDMPVPLAITSPIPSRSSWWRFSAGWTTVSALKGSQPPWVSWKFGSFLLIFNNPCHTVSSRSRHMKWLMPLKGSIAESFLSTWGATHPPCVLGCDKLFFRWRDGYTKLHISHTWHNITYLFFSCVCHGMSSRELLSCWTFDKGPPKTDRRNSDQSFGGEEKLFPVCEKRTDITYLSWSYWLWREIWLKKNVQRSFSEGSAPEMTGDN